MSESWGTELDWLPRGVSRPEPECHWPFENFGLSCPTAKGGWAVAGHRPSRIPAAPPSGSETVVLPRTPAGLVRDLTSCSFASRSGHVTGEGLAADDRKAMSPTFLPIVGSGHLTRPSATCAGAVPSAASSGPRPDLSLSCFPLTASVTSLAERHQGSAPSVHSRVPSVWSRWINR